MAFSYAQIRALGWGFIAAMGALKSLREPNGAAARRAVWEGYVHGKAAMWLHNEDVATLFAEPLDAARARLNIAKPVAYRAAHEIFAAAQAKAAQLVAAE